MDVTVSAAEFKAALALVKPYATNRFIPAASGVKLGAYGDGKLSMTTTDLAGGVTVTIPTTAVTLGAEVLSFKALNAGMPKGKAKGEVVLRSGDEGEVVVVNGHTATLRSIPLGDFPIGHTSGGLAVDSLPLDPAVLALIAPAVGTDDSRPILTSVYLTDGQIVATDSYRLHVANVPQSYPNILLPAVLVKQIVKANRPATMLVTDKTVQVTAGNIVWWARTIEGSFPNYKGLIPTGYPNHVVTNRGALIEAIKHVKTAAVHSTTPVRLHLFADHIDLEVITQDVGKATATVWAKLDGIEQTVAFNPAYLLDCLAAGTTSDVELSVLDGLKPAVITDVRPTGPSALRLLMPVRIS